MKDLEIMGDKCPTNEEGQTVASLTKNVLESHTNPENLATSTISPAGYIPNITQNETIESSGETAEAPTSNHGDARGSGKVSDIGSKTAPPVVVMSPSPLWKGMSPDDYMRLYPCPGTVQPWEEMTRDDYLEFFWMNGLMGFPCGVGDLGKLPNFGALKSRGYHKPVINKVTGEPDVGPNGEPITRGSQDAFVYKKKHPTLQEVKELCHGASVVAIMGRSPQHCTIDFDFKLYIEGYVKETPYRDYSDEVLQAARSACDSHFWAVLDAIQANSREGDTYAEVTQSGGYHITLRIEKPAFDHTGSHHITLGAPVVNGQQVKVEFKGYRSYTLCAPSLGYKAIGAKKIAAIPDVSVLGIHTEVATETTVPPVVGESPDGVVPSPGSASLTANKTVAKQASKTVAKTVAPGGSNVIATVEGFPVVEFRRVVAPHLHKMWNKAEGNTDRSADMYCLAKEILAWSITCGKYGVATEDQLEALKAAYHAYYEGDRDSEKEADRRCRDALKKANERGTTEGVTAGFHFKDGEPVTNPDQSFWHFLTLAYPEYLRHPNCPVRKGSNRAEGGITQGANGYGSKGSEGISTPDSTGDLRKLASNYGDYSTELAALLPLKTSNKDGTVYLADPHKLPIADKADLFDALVAPNLSRNARSLEIYYKGNRTSINALLKALTQEHRWALPREYFYDWVSCEVEKRDFDPFLDYLESVKGLVGKEDAFWAEFETLAKILFGSDDPYHQTALTRWLLSVVARAYRPGCKADLMLILKGGQGVFKTSFFAALVDIGGDDILCQTVSKFDDGKDTFLNMTKRVLVEMGEVDHAFSTQANSELKDKISRRVDTVRVPYGKEAKDIPRRFVLCASTNEAQFLNDATGDRRYLVIEVKQDINMGWVKANRDRLWSCLVQLFERGEQWWLTRDEDEARDAANNGFRDTYSHQNELDRAFAIWEESYDTPEESHVFSLNEWASVVLGGGMEFTPKMSKWERLDLAKALRAKGMTVNQARVKGAPSKDGRASVVFRAGSPLTLGTPLLSDFREKYKMDLPSQTRLIDKGEEF